MPEAAPRPDGIPGSSLPGPWPVGQYAAALRERLRRFARVQVFGEVFGLKAGRAKVWFELRDGSGALPCSMWRKDWDALGLESLGDGSVVVAAGGCDFYPGSRASSPSFSFTVSALRVAGEGDLLAQVERLRKALPPEGLLEPQKRLARPSLPRVIGVVTGEGGKARDDVLAGLRRRGWAGRVVWAFAPGQDRHAAPAITRALQDLAACRASPRARPGRWSWWRGGAARSPTCSRSATRRCAGPSRCCACPSSPPSATTPTTRSSTTSPRSRAPRRRTPPRRPCRSTARPTGPRCRATPRGSSARAGGRSSTGPARSRG